MTGSSIFFFSIMNIYSTSDLNSSNQKSQENADLKTSQLYPSTSAFVT